MKKDHPNPKWFCTRIRSRRRRVIRGEVNRIEIFFPIKLNRQFFSLLDFVWIGFDNHNNEYKDVFCWSCDDDEEKKNSKYNVLESSFIGFVLESSLKTFHPEAMMKFFFIRF